MATHHTPLSRAIQQTLTREPDIGPLVWEETFHSDLPHVNVITTLPDGATVASKCHPASKFPLDTQFDRRSVWLEWRIMRRASDLVRSGTIPNFVRHYHAYVAPTRVPRAFGKPTPEWALYTINEYCDGGDLEHWQMAGGPHSPEEWQSMMGQFLLAYLVLSKMMHVVHNDMHWGNLLMKKVTPGGYWWYIVKRGNERHDFFVPNTGQLWKLWDFGQSYVLPPPLSPDASHFVRTRQSRDMENLLMGPWDFARKQSQHPVLRGECKHSMDNLFSRHRDALEILCLLGWFKERPEGPPLNEHPYIITSDS